jgi:three-Cys-motif partner protein
MLNAGCKSLTYLDLFAGRGEYEDGEPATAKMVLDVAYNHGKIGALREKLRLRLNESNQTIVRELERVVNDHPLSKQLALRPLITHSTVEKSYKSNLTPDECTFTFIDPWGYKGISMDLLMEVIGNWGSDCLFYLSIRGIRRNLDGQKQRQDLQGIFGESGLKAMQKAHNSGGKTISFYEVVLGALRNAINQRQPAYVLPFVMEFEQRKAVSHCLVFITKHPRGFHLMKDIMAGESFVDSEGFPEYFYRGLPQLSFAFESKRRKTAHRMMKDFAGANMLVKQVIDKCDELGYEYPKRNLKQALLMLEDEGKLDVDRARDKRQTRNGQPTLGDSRRVQFLTIE